MRSIYLLVIISFFSFESYAQNNEFSIISDIIITGNEKTKNSIILRELDFEKGDTLYFEEIEEKINLNRNKIVNLQLFLSVDLKVIKCENPFAELQINLSEQFYIFPFPVFRLADRSFNEWWYNRGHKLNRTIYGVNLVHLNVGGRAEELILNLENGFTRQLGIIFRKPYIDKKMKTGFDFELFYNTNKQIAYRTDLDKLVFARNDESVLLRKFTSLIALRRRNNFFVRQRLELAYFNETLSDSISALNPNYYLDSRAKTDYFRLSYAYIVDHRNNLNYANTGHYFKARLSRTGLFKNDQLSQNEAYFVYAHFFDLGKKWYVDYNIRGKITSPKLQAFAISQALGYKNENIRGFDLHVIDGQKFGIFKTNFRRQIFDTEFKVPAIGVLKSAQKQPLSLYARAFVDGGYVWNKYSNLNNSQYANRFITGYGLGVDLVSIYTGALKISYSFNNFGDRGLYFAYGREF
ncbi:MAG: BamA/TamA family outer membrane protein [Bacteroidota bacterium]